MSKKKSRVRRNPRESKQKKSWWAKFSAWVEGEEPLYEKSRPLVSVSGNEHKVSDLTPYMKIYRVLAVLIALCVVSVLMVTVYNLPLFGSPYNPASNEVVQRYIESGLQETGAVNIVAGMILDYRAFDTFGESSVLFLAVTSVMILLMRDRNNIDLDEDTLTARELILEGREKDIILRKVSFIVIPCILIFGICVVLNGHLSPGGGFSGGAIMGSALILYSVSFGSMEVNRFFSMKTFRKLTTTALLIYAASKAYSFFTGANGLPTGIPLGTPGAILSSGLIFVLDICVGLVVTCTMYGFYALFSKGEI